MPDHPVEISDDEVVVTYSCPKCVKHHPRESYEEVGRVTVSGIVHRLYRCPAGQQVVLDMQVDFRKGDAMFIDLDPQEPPA